MSRKKKQVSVSAPTSVVEVAAPAASDAMLAEMNDRTTRLCHELGLITANYEQDKARLMRAIHESHSQYLTVLKATKPEPKVVPS